MPSLRGVVGQPERWIQMIRGWSVQKTRIVCIGPATTGRVGGGRRRVRLWRKRKEDAWLALQFRDQSTTYENGNPNEKSAAGDNVVYDLF